jgi:hypothetical protein
MAEKRNRRAKARVSDVARVVNNVLVRYYDEGWRIGYLTRATDKTGTVQPIAGYKGKKPHTLEIPIKDIEIIEQNGDNGPKSRDEVDVK